MSLGGGELGQELAPGDAYLSTRCVSWMPVHILFVIRAGPSLVLKSPTQVSSVSCPFSRHRGGSPKLWLVWDGESSGWAKDTPCLLESFWILGQRREEGDRIRRGGEVGASIGKGGRGHSCPIDHVWVYTSQGTATSKHVDIWTQMDKLDTEQPPIC